MHYQSRRSRFQNKYFKSSLILGGIFLLCFVVFSFLGETLIKVASPFWQAENSTSRGVAGVFSFFTSKDSLIEENSTLSERVAFLENRVMNLERERGEESAILELYGRTPESGEIAASILVGPPQTPYDMLIIDAGSEDAVSVDSKVYLLSGALAGSVSEVFSDSARVKLFSTSGEANNAVLERGDVPVVLDGIGGGNFKITLPRDVVVERGDRILSSDIEASLIGVVEDVRLTQTDSFKTVIARSPVNIFSLRLVLVRP